MIIASSPTPRNNPDLHATSLRDADIVALVLDRFREGKGWFRTGIGRGRDGAGQV